MFPNKFFFMLCHGVMVGDGVCLRILPPVALHATISVFDPYLIRFYGWVAPCHDLYRSHAINEVTKKKQGGLPHTSRGRPAAQTPPAGGALQHPDSGAPLQKLPPMEEPTEDSLGDRPRGDPQAPRPHPGPGPHQHRGAARRRAVQPGGARFPSTDFDRTAGPPVANEEDDAASEASEWKARERAEWDWERMAEEDRLGAEF